MLHAQQSIELIAGNDLKFNSMQNTEINAVKGLINLNSQLQCIAQIGGDYCVQSNNGNINHQIVQGNFNLYSQAGITIQSSGNIILKNYTSALNINNVGIILMQAQIIYINAPQISLQKNVLINNVPL